ncbi:Serine/threonine-protein kinase plk1 [Parelaphostrongylus tenuis]|uniref:Serine/threonine-protein kinase PLK n=1 Tax=Parelaphostrongylus tenuis TaxID=148309 RepID=A0AAD5QHI4_PARTN|nr:Serine/threonine-protein kinase plk1 [Parelaphostrongylus tenuis]
MVRLHLYSPRPPAVAAAAVAEQAHVDGCSCLSSDCGGDHEGGHRDSRDRDRDGPGGGGGGPSLFKPGDRIVDEYSRQEFYVDQYLGRGGFAECFAVRSNLLRGQFALKVVEKGKLRDPYYSKMHREIKLHRSVSHPNIVHLYGSFQNSHYFFLVMELCREQTLLTLINQSKRGYLSECESRGYMVGILSAVSYLLEKNILHRDLKPGNILIGSDGQVKLADFGLAILMQDLNPLSVSGTPNYLAPEILMKRGHSEFSEVWSIGCMLYCMLIGKPPFESDSLEETYSRIQNGQYTFPASTKISPEARNLINRCLIHSVSFRPTIRQLQEDPWVAMNHSVPKVLLRTKSLKELSRQDVNGNILHSVHPHRPRSTIDLASPGDNKSHRESIVSTHDSGFGSDPDMSRRPILAATVNGYLKDIDALLGGASNFSLEPCSLPPWFVTKWVDYTNRRGFGCQFSDGSISVKFNEGLCLSWQANSSTFIYAQTPFSSPHAVHPAMLQNSGLTRSHIEVARQYREYMERELADTDLLMSQVSRKAALSSSSGPPYLVFTRLVSDCLIMIFSDGTAQINLKKRRSKIVLWSNDGGSDDNGSSKFTSVAIVEHGFAPFAFRIRPQHIYGFELPKSLEDCLFVVRRALNMECDFLHYSRLPLHSTQC